MSSTYIGTDIADLPNISRLTVNYVYHLSVCSNEWFVGIWADDSDDEDRRPAFKSNAPKSYTAPIGFVAGGVQQAGKKVKKEDAIKEEKSDSEDEKPSTSFKRKGSSSDSENEEVLRTSRCYVGSFFVWK